MARRERPVAPSRGSAEGPLGSAYLEAATGSHELAKRLQAVWKHLTDLGQDDRPQGLDGTTKAIASSRILDHTGKARTQNKNTPCRAVLPSRHRSHGH